MNPISHTPSPRPQSPRCSLCLIRVDVVHDAMDRGYRCSQIKCPATGPYNRNDNALACIARDITAAQARLRKLTTDH